MPGCLQVLIPNPYREVMNQKSLSPFGLLSFRKNDKAFVISFKDLRKLKEESRISFFQNITTQVSAKERKYIYRYEDESGVIHPFIYYEIPISCFY